MPTNIKFYEDQPHTLAGAGVSLGDTTMVLSSFVGIDGTLLTMANFGVIGFGTVEQGTRREEAISFTGVTQNIDGTATLTGIKHVTFGYPYTQTSGFARSHAGSTFFVISNNPGLLDTMANKQNDGTIIAQWTFNALANNANPKIDSNSYVFTDLDYITKGYADGKYLRTDGTNQMLADLNFGNHKGINLADPVNPKDAVNLETLQATAIAGATPATESAGGIVKVATDAEVAAVQDTTTIGPLTFYNMAKLSQIKSVASESKFTYGETIAVNDYVFQASGNEISNQNWQTTADGQDGIPLTTVFKGAVFQSLDGGNSISAITVSLKKLNTPTGNAVMKITAVSGGVPTGSVLATSNTFNVATLGSINFSNVTFTFATPFVPSPATQYGFYIDASAVTFGASGDIFFQYGTGVGLGGFGSTDSGSTWSTVANTPYYTITNNYTAGRVYKAYEDYIFDCGPYIGFAQQNGVAGDIKNVQLNGVASGFTSLTPSGQVYINSSVAGGITQTQSGRCVGVAISATDIEMYQMHKVSVQTGLSTSGQVIPADGTLLVDVSHAGTPSSISIVISKDNFLTDPGISYLVFQVSISENVRQGVFSFPVSRGNGYRFTGDSATGTVNLYRTIDG